MTVPRRPVLAACILVLVVAGPFVQDLSAQSAPRIAATGALVDDGTHRIDGYLLGVDFAERNGHLYSDKAPGQQILSVPVYAVARVAGAEPARVHRVHENLTLWWVSFVSGVLPLVAIVVLAARALARRGLPVRASVLSVSALGTLLLPFGSNLYGHTLAAALAFGAWTALDAGGGRWRPWAAGGLVGLAVVVEYQAVLVALVLVVWLVAARRLPDVVRTVLGAAPFAALLLGYHVVVFGGPFESGYSAKAIEGTTEVSTHLAVPSITQAIEVLVGSRGLLLMTPLAVLGMVGLARRSRYEGDGAAAGVGLAVMTLYVLMHASWTEAAGGVWAGEMPGPRYVTAAMPFLVVGIADTWERVTPMVRGVVAGISVTTMLLATALVHLIPDGESMITVLLDRLRKGELVPTVFTMALGSWGWAVHAVLVAVALLLVRRWPLASTGERGATRSEVPAAVEPASGMAVAGR